VDSPSPWPTSFHLHFRTTHLQLVRADVRALDGGLRCASYHCVSAMVLSHRRVGPIGQLHLPLPVSSPLCALVVEGRTPRTSAITTSRSSHVLMSPGFESANPFVLLVFRFICMTGAWGHGLDPLPHHVHEVGHLLPSRTSS
jgi:hypothetical protein